MPRFVVMEPKKAHMVEDHGQVPECEDIRMTTQWRIDDTIDHKTVEFFASKEDADARASYLNEP